MAGRNHHRELPLQSRAHPPAVVVVEDPVHRRPSSHHREDRVAALQRELQAILLENQRLAATHVALKQELSLTHQDLRHLAAAAPKIKAEREADVREVLEKSVKFEAGYCAVEAHVTELAVVRKDIETLKLEKVDLGAQLKSVNGDLERAKLELKQLPEIKAQMEIVAEDLRKGRAAMEIEMKNRKTNLEHGRKMERTMASLRREIDKLRAELADVEKRDREAAAAAAAAAANPGPGYATMYSNTNMMYGGGYYPVQYPMHQAQSHHMHGHVSNAAPYYSQGPMLPGAYNTQLPNGQI